MGMFDFLKKKKDPEFPSFHEPIIPGESTDYIPRAPVRSEEPDSFSPEPMSMPMQSFGHEREKDMMGKDLEIISAKLDALKSSLDAINQRLANLERIAAGEKDEHKYF